MLSCKEKGDTAENPSGNNNKDSKTASTLSGAETKSSSRKPRDDSKLKAISGNTLNDFESVRSRLFDSNPLNADEKREISQFFENGDLEDCKKLLAEMLVDDSYDSFLTTFTRRFATEDIDSAISWLKDSGEDPKLQTAYSIIGTAAGKHPDAAERFIKDIKDPGLKSYFSGSYITSLVNLGNASELDEIVKSESKRAELGLNVPQLAGALSHSRKTPENTTLSLGYMKVLLEGYEGSLKQFDKAALAEMIGPNSLQAAEFIDRNANSKGVAEVFTGPLVQQWAKTDPGAASNWLRNQTGSAKDAGIIGFVYSTAKLQPQPAMQWAVSASDPNVRKRAVETVISNTLIGKEQIRSVIANSDLSNGEKDSYYKLISN